MCNEVHAGMHLACLLGVADTAVHPIPPHHLFLQLTGTFHSVAVIQSVLVESAAAARMALAYSESCQESKREQGMVKTEPVPGEDACGWRRRWQSSATRSTRRHDSAPPATIVFQFLLPAMYLGLPSANPLLFPHPLLPPLGAQTSPACLGLARPPPPHAPCSPIYQPFLRFPRPPHPLQPFIPYFVRYSRFPTALSRYPPYFCGFGQLSPTDLSHPSEDSTHAPACHRFPPRL